MFARLAAISTLAFVALAAAGGKCNTGDVQCCNTLANSNSVLGSSILKLAGVAAGGVTALVGVDCSPVTALSVGSSQNCKTEPVCCSDNSHAWGSLAVSIGCAPVSAL